MAPTGAHPTERDLAAVTMLGVATGNHTTSLAGLVAAERTLVSPLLARASDARAPLSLLRDALAPVVAHRLGLHVPRTRSAGGARCVLRARAFDHAVMAFLEASPDGAVVELAVGLDTRFERLGAPDVPWFELDLPRVIDVRRRVLSRGRRPKLVACAIEDPAWLACVPPTPVCFILEAALAYLAPGAMLALLERLATRRARTTLVLDVGDRYDGSPVTGGGPFELRRDIPALLAARCPRWHVRAHEHLFRSSALRPGRLPSYCRQVEIAVLELAPGARSASPLGAHL